MIDDNNNLNPNRRKWDNVDTNDNHNLSLHFTLMEVHMKRLEEEVKDTKDLVRDNRKTFLEKLAEDKQEINERINKIDNRLWAILLMTLGTLLSVVLTKFF